MARSAVIAIALLSLILAGIPTITGASTNHVVHIKDTSNGVLYLRYSDGSVINNFSLDFKVVVDRETASRYFKIYSEYSAGSIVSYTHITFNLGTKIINYYNETHSIRSLMSFVEGKWYHISYFVRNDTPYLSINGHTVILGAKYSVTFVLYFDVDLTNNEFYLDNLYINENLVEDAEDGTVDLSQTVQSGTWNVDIIDDPNGVFITNPMNYQSVSVPFSINFTNPDGTVKDVITYDFGDKTLYNGSEITTIYINDTSLVPPGWHTFLIYAYDVNNTLIGWGQIHLYVLNGQQPDSGAAGEASGGSGGSGSTSSGSSDSNSGTGSNDGDGSGGASGGMGDSGTSGTSGFIETLRNHWNALDDRTKKAYLAFLVFGMMVLLFILLGGKRRW